MPKALTFDVPICLIVPVCSVLMQNIPHPIISSNFTFMSMYNYINSTAHLLFFYELSSNPIVASNSMSPKQQKIGKICFLSYCPTSFSTQMEML